MVLACTTALVTSSDRHSWAVSATSSEKSDSASSSRRNRRASPTDAWVVVEQYPGGAVGFVGLLGEDGLGSADSRRGRGVPPRRSAAPSRRAGARWGSSNTQASSRNSISPPIGDPMPGSGTAAIACTSAGWRLDEPAYRASMRSRAPSIGSPVRTAAVSGTSS